MTQVSLFVREHRMRKYAKANPKEREIPLPYFLLRALEARAGSGLIFHTTGKEGRTHASKAPDTGEESRVKPSGLWFAQIQKKLCGATAPRQNNPETTWARVAGNHAGLAGRRRGAVGAITRAS